MISYYEYTRVLRKENFVWGLLLRKKEKKRKRSPGERKNEADRRRSKVKGIR